MNSKELSKLIREKHGNNIEEYFKDFCDKRYIKAHNLSETLEEYRKKFEEDLKFLALDVHALNSIIPVVLNKYYDDEYHIYDANTNQYSLKYRYEPGAFQLESLFNWPAIRFDQITQYMYMESIIDCKTPEYKMCIFGKKLDRLLYVYNNYIYDGKNDNTILEVVDCKNFDFHDAEITDACVKRELKEKTIFAIYDFIYDLFLESPHIFDEEIENHVEMPNIPANNYGENGHIYRTVCYPGCIIKAATNFDYILGRGHGQHFLDEKRNGCFVCSEYAYYDFGPENFDIVSDFLTYLVLMQIENRRYLNVSEMNECIYDFLDLYFRLKPPFINIKESVGFQLNNGHMIDEKVYYNPDSEKTKCYYYDHILRHKYQFGSYCTIIPNPKTRSKYAIMGLNLLIECATFNVKNLSNVLASLASYIEGKKYVPLNIEEKSNLGYTVYIGAIKENKIGNCKSINDIHNLSSDDYFDIATATFYINSIFDKTDDFDVTYKFLLDVICEKCKKEKFYSQPELFFDYPHTYSNNDFENRKYIKNFIIYLFELQADKNKKTNYPYESVSRLDDSTFSCMESTTIYNNIVYNYLKLINCGNINQEEYQKILEAFCPKKSKVKKLVPTTKKDS